MSWYEQCIQAFADRDYATSSRLALEHYDRGIPAECELWLLIAAQRLHDPSFAAVRDDLIKLTADRPHWRAYVLAACGELDAEDADIYFTDRRHSCALNYYLGAGILTKGDAAAARPFFALAAVHGEDKQPELFLALSELNSPSPYGLNPLGNVRRLCESAVISYRCGFYRAAAEEIEAARALANDIPLFPFEEYAPLLRIAGRCHTTNRDLALARQIYEELLTVSASVNGRAEDAAMARLGLARLHFAVRDYSAAALGVRQALESREVGQDLESVEREERYLRLLAETAGPNLATEQIAALVRQPPIGL